MYYEDYEDYYSTDADWEDRIADARDAEAERHDFELEVGRAELHIIYAVLNTVHGTHKVRVSDPREWDEAQDLFNALFTDDNDQYIRPVVQPGYSVYGREVQYFCVRSTVDPDWPVHKPKLSITDDWTGKRLIDAGGYEYATTLYFT